MTCVCDCPLTGTKDLCGCSLTDCSDCGLCVCNCYEPSDLEEAANCMKNPEKYMTRGDLANHLMRIASDVRRGKDDEWVYADVTVHIRTIEEVKAAYRKKARKAALDTKSVYTITWPDGTVETVIPKE